MDFQKFESYRSISELMENSERTEGPDLTRSEAAAFVTLKKAFDALKEHPAIWKWLWNSKHVDAKKIRALMYCLVNWPFDNIPWQILTDTLNSLVVEATEERDDLKDMSINWKDKSNHIGLSKDEVTYQKYLQRKRKPHKGTHNAHLIIR